METVERYGEESCGNVSADLGLPDAEEQAIKSALGIRITLAIRRLGLTQVEAGKRMGISQAKV
jgi:predicted XRE-type DNA-binding protein